MKLKYLLFCNINNDIRQLPVEDLWQGMTLAYGTLSRHEGYPIKLTYGGVEICGDAEFNAFDLAFRKILNGKVDSKKVTQLLRLRSRTLDEIRRKLMPQ